MHEKIAQHRQRLLVLANRHSTRAVDLRLLRRIVKVLLVELLGEGEFELGIYLLDAQEITRLNEGYLQHRGATDVIAFDYGSTDREISPGKLLSRRAAPKAFGGRSNKTRLWGEICVCLDETVRQARRFHTTWQSELVRYVVHGLLHLLGYSDQQAVARRKMKREEDYLVGELSARFAFGKLGRGAAMRLESRR